MINTQIMKDKKGVLSTLWIFVTLNYIYCDVFSLMNSKELQEILSGSVGSIQMTEGFLLGAALVMEIPMAMILLSRFLKQKANRIANIIAGILMAVVQGLSLFVGEGPSPHYIFFSIIEISCVAFIVFFAWRWTDRKNEIGS
jgi:hypothetical protein